MGFSAQGFDTGLYLKRSRLSKDNAPNSNRCKVNCIDQGDIFCVDKYDLKSKPVCCPQECNDPDNNNVNMCSATLKALGSHVCSDQFTASRDEFKYLLCPRENMDDQCGEKVHKFDVVKDKKTEIKITAPWYKPGDPNNPSKDFALYKFDKQGICNYAFIMPDDAEIDSSFEIKFVGSDRTLNRNTQAYVASYVSGDENP